MAENFLASLEGIAPVLRHPEDLRPFISDWRGAFTGNAIAVVQPRSTEEVAKIVRLCAESRVNIVPQGGNTGLAAGATPVGLSDAIILSFAKLNRIREIDPIGNTMVVEAGCVLAMVQEEAAKVQRLFPLSLAAEGTAQIGGLISTNAGGTAVLRYGTMRALVLGLEVVLPDGQIANGLRALRKDNAGYDWKQLFIGTEGTLGCITAAVLRIFPQPNATVTALLGIDSPEKAVAIFGLLQGQLGETITACELFPDYAVQLRTIQRQADATPIAFPMRKQPWYLLIECTSSLVTLRPAVENALEEILEKEFAGDCVVAESSTQAESLWEWREAIAEVERRAGASAKHDVAIPTSAVPAFIAETTAAVESTFPGTRCIPFGHIGDGNVHFNVLLPRETAPSVAEIHHLVHGIVARYRGSITAEHGIGRYRRTELRKSRSTVELDLMQTIKQAVDPQGIMNPGAVLEQRK